LGALAYIILSDEFAGNVHGNDVEAFKFDKFSIAAAKEIIADPQRYNTYRWFEKFTIMFALIKSEDLNDAHLYFDLLEQARKETHDAGLDYVCEFFKNAYL